MTTNGPRSLSLLAFLLACAIGCGPQQAANNAGGPEPNKNAAQQTVDAQLADITRKAHEKLLAVTKALELGEEAAGKEDWPRAKEYFAEAVRLDPENAEAQFGLGLVVFEGGDAKESLTALTKAIRLRPNKALWHLTRANAYHELENSEAALQDLAEAIRLDPKNQSARIVRAAILVEANKYAEAIADLDEAVRGSPNVHAYMLRGSAHMAQKQFDAALADLQEAIRLDPKKGQLYWLRGVTYQSTGKQAEADADFAKAKELGYEVKP